MKKLVLLSIVVLVLVISMASVAMAKPDPKYAGVQPTGNEQTGTISIPPLPSGNKIVNVWVWNDCLDSKPNPLGAVSNFKFNDKCDSFNFTWADSTGQIWWQMVKPSTKPGGDLKAIFHPEGYKYGFRASDVNR